MNESKATLFQEKRKIYYLAFILMAIFIGIFWFWRVYFYPFESTEDAVLQAVDMSISPVVSGQIIQMTVEEGAVVQKGDPLFVVDDTLLKFQKEKAFAAIQHAQDELQVQKIRRDLTRDDYMRAKTEFTAGIISEETMNLAEKNLEMAEAMLGSILSLVEVQVADLRMVEKQIELSHVVAPAAGVVAKVWHYAGDVVAAGQTTLTLMDLVNVWVDANIEETKIAMIHVGDPVMLTIDAYPDLSLTGTVVVVGAAAASQFALIPANNSSGNFTKVTQRVPLRISFNIPEENSMLYLRPGMSVKVKIRAR
ncbi:MAG: HlyD family secretion protein [Rhabdochlamydiaceae bacterium]